MSSSVLVVDKQKERWEKKRQERRALKMRRLEWPELRVHQNGGSCLTRICRG